MKIIYPPSETDYSVRSLKELRLTQETFEMCLPHIKPGIGRAKINAELAAVRDAILVKLEEVLKS